ncbi:heterogeneous nuclear ribonucleo 1-like [Olea europaea subsp. europaea]|nr:heterogeneous nuclear ribonucleo 1-like [Olea europaea subsp. europaea]
MKDRATGRARGFGFVVFADPVVAERVIKDKHRIDGRMVEAKKAIPRDDQSTGSRNSSRIQDSPGSGQTKKIFVGGLASTVTEGDFKKYFEQFGTITDVVVMYDHNTQRPRGFGFITYDLEDAVDKVLLKTFHELNGKMVEVKRAVPKELSPSPSRSPLGGYNYGIGRINSFLNGYPQGYSPNTMGGYGVRMDSRFSPIAGGRSNFTPFASDYALGLNYEPALGPAYGGGVNINSSLNYGRSLNPYYVNSSSNRFGNSVQIDGGNGGNSSFFSSGTHNLWGNGGVNYGTNSAGSSNYVESGSGNTGGGTFGNSGVWGTHSFSPQGRQNVPSQTGNFGYGGGDNTHGLAGGGYGRNISTSRAPTLSYAASTDSYDGALADLYDSSLGYLDPTWHSTNTEQEGSGSFGYGFGNGPSGIASKISPGYVGSDGGIKRQIDRDNGG